MKLFIFITIPIRLAIVVCAAVCVGLLVALGDGGWEPQWKEIGNYILHAK